MKWFSRHLDENYPCRKLYPGCTKEQCLQWCQEDAAYAEFARDVFQAVSDGVDVSFLWSCPDLTKLAMYRSSHLGEPL